MASIGRPPLIVPRRLFGQFGAAVAGACLLAACAGPPDTCGPIAADTGDGAGYRLGPGDQVQVTVFRQPELSGRFGLDGEAGLALPLVGGIPADGLSTRALEQAIAARLREDDYLITPQVSVQIVAYRPFYILGEVRRPGEYAYQNGMTVVNAVALAGGYTYRAQTSKITVRRAGCSFIAAPEAPVLPGEIITVPERFI